MRSVSGARDNRPTMRSHGYVQTADPTDGRDTAFLALTRPFESAIATFRFSSVCATSQRSSAQASAYSSSGSVSFSLSA